MNTRIKNTAVGALFFLCVPLVSLAAIDTPAAFIAKLNEIQDWMYTFLLALAVIFILVAAFIFLTSAGDPKKTEQAKNTIIYAVIAIIVAFLARAIVGIVSGILG
jgi:hypothetical protein